MKGYEKGVQGLRDISLENLQLLITSHSIEDLSHKFGVSYNVGRDIINEKFKELKIGFKKDIELEQKELIIEPFSKNEDDYGSPPEGKHIVTKRGIYMESDIVDEPTLLQLTIRKYKKSIGIWVQRKSYHLEHEH